MKKNKYSDFIPLLGFVVALICRCDIMEAVSVMMFTDIIFLKDKVKAIEELADSSMAE